MLHEENLHEYQRTAIEHIIKHRRSALFLEMGLGKTVSSLSAINKLMFEELEISRVLVIAPKRVAESVWDAEIANWSHLKHLRISRIIGSLKQRKEALRVNADIYTIGRDNIAWLCGQYGGSMLPFDMLIIDELSSFKNPKSIRFKALRNAQPSFKRVVGLTGTPAPNGLIDLWSQIYLLDRGERLGKFVTTYRSNYFVPASSNGNIVYKYGLRPGAEQEIYRRIGDICMSMKAKDYLSLPERIERVIPINFPQELQDKYDEFEKEQVLELLTRQEEEQTITALNAAALTNKLLQFANGAVYDEAKNWHVVHDLKIEAVQEIVEEAEGNPVLIAWTFRHDMMRLKEALKKYNPRELKTQEDIVDWNAGRINVMLMHPASGGHGLNLQAGGHIIVWFGQTWSLELYDQFNARLDRQGQTKPVITHKLVSRRTIDQRVLKAQSVKASGQSALMEAVKSIVEKYVSNHEAR